MVTSAWRFTRFPGAWWKNIAFNKNSAATQIFERPYGYRKLLEGFDIWIS